MERFFSGGRSQDYLEGAAIMNDSLPPSTVLFFRVNGVFPDWGYSMYAESSSQKAVGRKQSALGGRQKAVGTRR
jgi:hypothetical protein